MIKEKVISLNRLKNMHPWEWPEDAGEAFVQVLLDKEKSLADRMLAAELGGDPVVMNNELAQALLAVFCMIYVQGFEEEILESLKSPEKMIHYLAVQAAENWEMEEAWKQISSLALSPETDKDLRLNTSEACGDYTA
ncbi:MAG: hypothetical protein ACQEUB_07010 [Thermodesulfobacteriota bacterium]